MSLLNEMNEVLCNKNLEAKDKETLLKVKILVEALETKLPQVGETWKHFKGNHYHIIGITWNAEGDVLVPMVVYSNGDITFSRSLFNFLYRGNEARFTYERG